MPFRTNDPRRVWFFDDMDDLRVWAFFGQIRVQVELTEIASECHESLVIKMLIAKKDHQMVEPGPTNFCDHVRIKFTGNVNPFDESADGTAERFGNEVAIFGFHAFSLNLVWKQ